MPELPEVHTTVEGLKKTVIGKTIVDVWSDFHVGTKHGKRQTIKNKKYYENFRKILKGTKIIGAERRGKNILIHLDPRSDLKKSPKGLIFGYTIVVHMKMTGHLMYGATDPFIHLIFKLKNGKDLVLSDMRKFASVSIIETEKLDDHESLAILGIDPLDKKLTSNMLREIISKRKTMPIKSALLDQRGLAGIGNIYSDEILWATSIHPLSAANKVPKNKFAEILKVMREILKFSIEYGGDSKSDYRNIFGEKGGFQNFHKVYGKKNKKCPKRGCSGIIQRIVVRGRSSHYCPVHQFLYKK